MIKGNMIEDLDKLLKSAATEVFGTMLNIRVEFEQSDAPLLNGEAHIAGAVGFTGKFNGVIYLSSDIVLARIMTGSLLSLRLDEIEGDEMVNDAIGELTNMISGFVKSRLCDRGLICGMTIPSVVRGKDFQIQAVSGANRQVVRLRANGKPVCVEALVKP